MHCQAEEILGLTILFYKDFLKDVIYMKSLKAMLAAVLAISVMTSAAACGSTDDSAPESSSLPEISSGQSEASDSESSKDNSEANSESSSDSSDSEKTTKEAEESDNSDSTADTTEAENSESSDTGNEESKKDETSKNEESSESSQSSDKKPSAETSSSENSKAETSQSGSSTGSSSGGTSSSDKNTGSSSSGTSGSSSSGENTGSSSGGSSSANNNDTPSVQETTEAPTEAPTQAATEETIQYAAEISLGNTCSFTGSNVTVSEQKVTITAGGIYLLEGTLTDGQVEVNTTEKVELYLNGVNIKNSTGPAILITDAKRAEIKLLADTSNILTDAGNDVVQDGVIFSNDTLEIKGKGTLKITAGNAHGIVSDDDIIIDNGNLIISSIKSGLFANDDITLNGGKLNIKAGTNGIKSKGTLNINGGYAEISGGQKEEKSSIYVASTFNYTGGTVFASGNVVSVPTQTSIPYIVAGCTQQISYGTPVTLTLNGTDAVTFTPHSNFKCVLMLSPDITTGSSFAMSLGDEEYSGYTVSAIQNVFTLF